MRLLGRIAAFTALAITFSGSSTWGGTIGFWRFEDGGGSSTIDSSGNGNPAVLSNATFDTNVPVTPVPTLGLANTGSVDLTGSASYLTVPHAPILNPATSITVEAWVKLDSSLPVPSAAGVVSRQFSNDSRDSFQLAFRNTNSSVFFSVTNVGGTAGDAEAFVSLVPDIWTHLAGVYDGSELRLYLNGSLAASSLFSGSIGYAIDKPIQIGADNEGGPIVPSFFFPGRIDEVRISDTALEPSQMLVPEPSPAVLLLLGGCCIWMLRRCRSINSRSGLAVVALVLTLPSSAAAVGYAVTDLGPGVANAINSLGDIVGQRASGHAFLFSNGAVTDLGTLGGPTSFAHAINDIGEIVGSADTADGNRAAFVYRNGTMEQIGGPSSVWAHDAFGINNAGQIVGRAVFADQGTAFLLENDTLSPILGMPTNTPLSPPIGSADAIGPDGTIVGHVQSGSGWTAYYFRDGQRHDVGGLGGVLSEFRAINGAGQITGQSLLPGDQWYHATLYSGGSLTDLGTPDGTGSTIGLAINASGNIAGQWFEPDGVPSRAILYSSGEMSDLNTYIDPDSGWHLESATGITDSGLIVGYGQLDGERHAFLLTPVPEPSTLVLASAGLASLIGLAWPSRKKKPLACQRALKTGQLRALENRPF